ncbi:exopolysaccharide biosynthesis protein ExoD [Devosia pacifica]|uniref:Exopolysaccharide biosynthesis protein ExoD n=1 Tax=Devosia pacifica TaxID=1335967 RepID=A0A918SDM0_9HYPH|nr:exopolysaccharide biosynthesis protein [Devosia pacifica]GHA36821.1 exopolysaccharide biosynthesis protein ExoD [Devosia pacifica]
MTRTRYTSPVEADVAAITGTLRAAIEDGRRRVTVRELIDLLGDKSHLLVILVFCILNMLPGPPGYGGTMAAAIFTFSIAMVRAKSIWLPGFLGKRRLSTRLLIQMLERMGSLTRLMSKISRTRLEWLAGKLAQRILGVFMMMLCLPMAVPIPFMNAIPNVGLTVLCIALLNRDGILVGAGIALALIGVTIDVGVIWFVITLGLHASGMW